MTVARRSLQAPVNVKGNTNIAILGTRGFGLLAGDQIDALEKEPPSAVDFFRAGFVTPPLNGTERVYFTAAGADWIQQPYTWRRPSG
jgi:hypothetical protein